MRPSTTDEIFELIDAYVASAAVGAAMEHGLFWFLADSPRPTAEVASALGLAEDRSGPWLELIAGLGLLDRVEGGYVLSASGRAIIVEPLSRDTWAFLAREARERFPGVVDLAVHLGGTGTAWEKQGLTPPDYFTRLVEDPVRAREFTRMLYEIHHPLAEELARSLPMAGVRTMLDVGGGSGVVSLALLRSHPGLRAVVVDVANVCAAGREIAGENALADRIEYRSGDFDREDLPSGFDLVLYCDVGGHDESRYRRLRRALNPGGRVVIVDKLGSGGRPHPSRAHWALLGALSGAPGRAASAEDVVRMLEVVGFGPPDVVEIPGRGSRWTTGWTRVVAHA